MGLRVRKTLDTSAVAATPLAPLMAETLSFQAKTVRVDNYSGRWLRVDPDGQYVPPFTIGVVIDLFVFAQTVSVFRQTPTSVFIPSVAKDGPVIVSIYDEAVLIPSPGTLINPPYVQHAPGALQAAADIVPNIPGDYEQLQMSKSFNMFLAQGRLPESWGHIQQRQLLEVQGTVQAVAAGVVTNVAGIIPTNVLFWRVLWMIVSTDVAGDVLINCSGGAYSLGLYRGFLAIGAQAVVPMDGGNGINISGIAATRFTARHAAAANVYLTVGLGLI